MALSSKRKRTSDLDIDTAADLLRDRMNAAVFCLSHSWGGLEQVAASDALELARLGLQARVICLPNTPIHDFLVKSKEVEVQALDFHPRDHFDFNMKKLLKDLLEREGVNLLHTHQTSLLASIVPWMWRKPNVVLLASRHILNSHNKKDPYHSLVYRRVDAVVVMSETLRRNVLETHRLRERQVKIIHLGLDFDEFDPDEIDVKKQRAEWGADKDTVVIGMVGRIDPAKGQSVFIKAAAGLTRLQEYKDNLKFVIVGEETRGGESEYVDELKKLIAEFRLEDRVILPGFKENIPEIMASFDIFVMPSRQEAFGLVAIEAMAMECPIVISRGGSSAEIVGEQEFGLLVRPDDAFDLQGQLRWLLERPEERARMGKRAREHVKKHYDREVRLERTLQLYERSLRIRGQ